MKIKLDLPKVLFLWHVILFSLKNVDHFGVIGDHTCVPFVSFQGCTSS